MVKKRRRCWQLQILVILAAAASASLTAAPGSPPTVPAAQEVQIDNPFAEGGPGQPYRILGDKRWFGFPMGTLAFSANGKLLAGAEPATGGKIAIVDIATGKTLHQLKGHLGYVNQLVFAPDGNTLYTGGHPNSGGNWHPENMLFVWNVATGKQQKAMHADLWELSADGKTLVVAENYTDFGRGFQQGKPPPSSFAIHLWETPTWKELGQFGDTGVVLSTLRLANDGTTLALAASDGTIRLWDLKTRKEHSRIVALKVDPKKQSFGTIAFLAFNQDGTRLASAMNAVLSNSYAVQLWDVVTGKEIQTLARPQSSIAGLEFTPKGNQLICTTQQGFWYLFDAASGKQLSQNRANADSANVAIALYRHGLTPEQSANPLPLVTNLWDLATGEDVLSGKEPYSLRCFAFAPDDRTVLAGDRRGIIRFWNIATGKEIRRLVDPKKSDLAGFSFMQDGKLLMSWQWDRTIHLWDLGTGDLVQSFRGGGREQRAVAVSADGKLASVSLSTTAALWGSIKDKTPRTITLPTRCWAVQFTPDGKGLLAGGPEGPVHLIDVASGKLVRSVGRGDVWVFDVSPDGRTLATFSRNEGPPPMPKCIRIWDLATGEELSQITTAIAPAGLRFTPDGRGLLVGLELWELSSGQVRTYLTGAWPATFSNNGRLVTCLMRKNAAAVWHLTGRNTGGVLDATPITPDQLTNLWADFQGNAGDSYKAMWRLAGVPDQTLPLFEEKLRAIPALDKKRVAVLIADLDSDKFATREKAMQELPKYGRWALQEVLATLTKNPPLEVRLRLKDLQSKLRDHPFSPEQILALRMVEVLEQCGTPAAWKLLERLATDEKPQFTDAAREALGRWKKV